MIINNVILRLLRHRSRQLRLEREKREALEEANSILSAYLALFVDGRGVVKIPKERVRSAIGRYSARVDAEGGNYVISIDMNGESEGFDRG